MRRIEPKHSCHFYYFLHHFVWIPLALCLLYIPFFNTSLKGESVFIQYLCVQKSELEVNEKKYDKNDMKKCIFFLFSFVLNSLFFWRFFRLKHSSKDNNCWRWFKRLAVNDSLIRWQREFRKKCSEVPMKSTPKMGYTFVLLNVCTVSKLNVLERCAVNYFRAEIHMISFEIHNMSSLKRKHEFSRPYMQPFMKKQSNK